MKEIVVKYLLNEEEEERLKKIHEEYMKQGMESSEDRIFEIIMISGFRWDVDDKFRFHEWKLGLRENFSEKDSKWHIEKGQFIGKEKNNE